MVHDDKMVSFLNQIISSFFFFPERNRSFHVIKKKEDSILLMHKEENELLIVAQRDASQKHPKSTLINVFFLKLTFIERAISPRELF